MDFAKKTQSTDLKSKPRRKRDPVATRAAILEAAKTVLAEDGLDSLSVSRVAHLAGVNRGTAYQHFQTREELVQATLEMVADQLARSVFSDPDTGELAPTQHSVQHVVESIVAFAMENPELGRIWFFNVLSSSRPAEDQFFKLFSESMEQAAELGFMEENVDIEALSVIMLAGYFIWPAWVRSHAHSKQERIKMANRLTREMLRLSLYGIMRPELQPKIAAILKQKADS